MGVKKTLPVAKDKTIKEAVVENFSEIEIEKIIIYPEQQRMVARVRNAGQVTVVEGAEFVTEIEDKNNKLDGLLDLIVSKF